MRIDREEAAISPWTLPFSLVDVPADTLLVWDAVEQEFRPAGEAGLAPGQGVWVYTDADSVVLGGDVMLDPTWTTYLLPGLNMIGAPYPVAINPAESGLAQLPVTPKVQTAEGWPDLLVPGRGLWVDVGGTQAVAWTEARPFEHSFGGGEAGPVIQSVTAGPGGSWIMNILGSGEAGEWFEVFYKDLDPFASFDPATGWSLAVSDLRPGSDAMARWSFRVEEWRSVSTPAIRLYLVGRGDIDSDGDGVSDARIRYTGPKNIVGEETASEIGSTTDRIDTESLSELSSGDDYDPPLRILAPPVVPDGSGHRTIYVDAVRGDASYSGLAAMLQPPDGPKPNFTQAYDEALSGDTVVIAQGVYREGTKLIRGKSVVIRPVGTVIWR